MLIGLVLVVRLARGRERRWFERFAAAHVDDGTITPEEMHELGSVRRRWRAASRGRRPAHGGRPGSGSRACVQRQQINLAMVASRVGDAPDHPDLVKQRDLVRALKAEYAALAGSARAARGATAAGSPRPRRARRRVRFRRSLAPLPLAPPLPPAWRPPPAWQPTHRVPDEGMAAWAAPDPTRAPMALPRRPPRAGRRGARRRLGAGRGRQRLVGLGRRETPGPARVAGGGTGRRVGRRRQPGCRYGTVHARAAGRTQGSGNISSVDAAALTAGLAPERPRVVAAGTSAGRHRGPPGIARPRYHRRMTSTERQGTPAEPAAGPQTAAALIELIRRSVVGDDEAVAGPFGVRRVTYADYTASGRSLVVHRGLPPRRRPAAVREHPHRELGHGPPDDPLPGRGAPDRRGGRRRHRRARRPVRRLRLDRQRSTASSTSWASACRSSSTSATTSPPGSRPPSDRSSSSARTSTTATSCPGASRSPT